MRDLVRLTAWGLLIAAMLALPAFGDEADDLGALIAFYIQ